MSGPDDRRGPDGGEHPLDVDARFADIIAHFHDDEPSPPRVVDSYDAAEGTGTTPSDTPEGADPAGQARPDADGSDRPGTGTGSSAAGPPAAGPTAAGASAAGPSAAGPAGARPAARPAAGDLGAPADLAAIRRSYEARMAAEIDRAVDGPGGGHFVPADPPPLPRPDLPGRLAWTAVLAGPVLLLLCALMWRSAPSWLLGTIVTGIVVGFGYLVWRLPRSRDRDDPDDGAVV